MTFWDGVSVGFGIVFGAVALGSFFSLLLALIWITLNRKEEIIKKTPACSPSPPATLSEVPAAPVPRPRRFSIGKLKRHGQAESKP